MKKTHDDQLLHGGYSNTPLDEYIGLEKTSLPKRVLIDWLSVTFDFVNIYFDGYKTYQIDLESPLLKQLLRFFGFTGSLSELQKSSTHNGYAEGFQIGEHIFIYYGGEHTLNASKRYMVQLSMSGEACREFENFMDGNWNDLLTFLIANNSRFKRIDIAIDDFEATEIDIYDIHYYIKNRYFVSSMMNTDTRWNTGIVDGLNITTGYSITMGSLKSSQLVIYDKRLERKANGPMDLETNIWYRYEMRFRNDKADAVAKEYSAAITNNYSSEFMKLAKSLLLMMLELKTPKENWETNVSKWDILDKWDLFLDSVSKIKLETKHKIDTTLFEKKEWYKANYQMFDLKQLLYQDYGELKKMRVQMWIDGIDKFTEKDLIPVNYARAKYGKPPFTMQDVKDLKYSLELEKED